jgi:hypothetical protein
MSHDGTSEPKNAASYDHDVTILPCFTGAQDYINAQSVIWGVVNRLPAI